MKIAIAVLRDGLPADLAVKRSETFITYGSELILERKDGAWTICKDVHSADRGEVDALAKIARLLDLVEHEVRVANLVDPSQRNVEGVFIGRPNPPAQQG